MYGFTFGGATTLLHLLVLNPLRSGILILALTFSGLGSYISNNPGVGDRYGTDGMLTKLQDQVLKNDPVLKAHVAQIRLHFEAKYDASPVELTDEQLRYILGITDTSTDIHPKDVLLSPDERREAAWWFYLDMYARDGPAKAEQFFVGNRSGPPQKK